MKIAGYLIIAFGLVDLIGSFAGFDLWGSLGITLPEVVWRFSSYGEIALGYFLINLGSRSEEEEHAIAEDDQGAGHADGDPGEDGE